MEKQLRRSEIVFLYDVRDANPNGDPLDSNKPRIDEETGINLVTDVRLKRTIRDYLHDYKGQDIFVREITKEDGNIQSGKERAADFGTDPKEVANKVLEQCIDVRLFGATIPMTNDSVTFTGPVQFNMGRSLHKVSLAFIKGTGAFASNEKSKQKTFREEYIVPYSLIGFNGIINENAAKHTRLTPEDVDLLMEGIWMGTKNLISRSKFGQLPRLLLKVDYSETNYHIGELLSGIKLVTSKVETEIRGLMDYSLEIGGLLHKLDRNKQRIAAIYVQQDEDLKLEVEQKSVNLLQELKRLEVPVKTYNF